MGRVANQTRHSGTMRSRWTGGSITGARRLNPPSNIGWEIAVEPDSNGDVTIVLPITTDCTADGAICTSDGRKLSNRTELTVSGPEQ